MQGSNEMHYRAWPVDLELREAEGDGLTVTGIVVPYGVEAEIEELRPSGVIRYREAFAPGAFARAMRAPNRVSLTYNHDTAMGNRMGFGRSFQESSEGLVGTFRLDASSADKARDILESSHAGFSVGFYSLVPRAGSERPDSLVTRRSAILDHVAAVVQGAYKGAGVASIRGADLDLGEPTVADLEAEAQTRQDADLLAWIDDAAAEQARWDALHS
jgi:HK97 family phage prohead protease